jgi:TatD DNase family protein
MRTAHIPEGVLPDLTDTHCHLQDQAFASDSQAVIERARQSGLMRILLAGTDVTDSQAAAHLAEKHPDLMRFAAGVHPHAATSLSTTALASLRTLLRAPGAVAVGEIGLDYFRDLSPRTEQRSAFQAQLALAAELDLPVIMHVRDAVDDVLAILTDFTLPRRGVWHAFSADRGTAERALMIGFYLGAAGPVTYPKADELREVFRTTPLDRILIETDAPYLPPDGNRGARNEPALVGPVVRRLALTRDISPELLAAATRKNANLLFHWE